MKKQKIAITGAHGFLGQYVVKQLAADDRYNVVAFTRGKESLFSPDTLASFFDDASFVIHIAGANRGNDEEVFRINTLGTLGLLQGMEKFAPAAHIIYTSTFQIYDPRNIYAISKKSAEELMELYVQRSAMTGTILRIANIYGPGGRPFYNSVIATFMHLIKENKPIVINGDGSQQRDYIHVRDAADAIIKSLSYVSQEKIEYFDICSGQLSSLNEIITLMKKTDHFAVEYKRGTLESSHPTKKSFAKAEKLLHWRPTIKLADGLSELLT